MGQDLFKRTTFVVADAPAAARFYTQVFGMRIWYDNELVPDRRRVRLGDTILVFETDDVDALVKRLDGTRATVHAGPRDWEVPSVSGQGRIKLRTVSLFDPNGIYIEVGTKRAPPPA